MGEDCFGLFGMNIVTGPTSRHLIMRLLFFLPEEKQVRIERRLRGREDFDKLARADCVVVSFGKSGRTWLRVMLSRFYQVRYGLARRHLLSFDNLHNKIPAIPKIFFTHDNYLKDYATQVDPKALYREKRVVLMIRDPADVAVSQYYQWKFRMPSRKKRLNDYPSHGEDLSLHDFVMRPQSGLLKVIEFMNGWGRELDRIKNLLVVRYEDLRADPEDVLKRILDFIGTPGSTEHVREAVSFASVENMRQLERKRVFWLSGRRMLAKDRGNLDTYKVRRAKVGGYRDDFTREQLAAIDTLVNTRLLPVFGYARSKEASMAT
jgi:sulfotransferase family protein